MPVCQLCLKEKTLCQSHIIPDFMYDGYFDSPKGHFLQTSTLDKMIGNALSGVEVDFTNRKMYKPLPDGQYERLLCKTCEDVIGVYETYAKKSHFLDLSIDSAYHTKGDKTITISGLDYAKYKLFYLSLLWRMSISTRPTFKYVNLGKKYNEILRRMIYYGNPKKYYHFPILSSHFFNDTIFPHKLYLSPIQYDSKEYSMVHLLINGYVHNFIVSDEMSKYKFNPSFIIRQNGTITIRELNEGDAAKTAYNMQYGN